MTAAEFSQLFFDIPLFPSSQHATFKTQVEILDRCTITWHDVTRISTCVEGMLEKICFTREGLGAMAEFPIEYDGTKLGNYLGDELEKSWKMHHSLSQVRLRESGDAVQAPQITALSIEIATCRSKVEDKLQKWLQSDLLEPPPENLTDDMQVEMSNFSLQRLTTKPTLCQWDMLRMALNPDEIKVFNPFFEHGSNCLRHRFYFALVGVVRMGG